MMSNIPSYFIQPDSNDIKWLYSYVDKISNNIIPSCKWVKLVVAKFKKELELSKNEDYPFYFDDEEANRVLKVFDNYHHYKGKFAGKQFLLLEWQQFFIGQIFGWKRKNNHLRRYKTIYCEIARKNGKTLIGAGIGLYMLDQDGENAAEIYSAATTRQQAKIVFNDAKQIVKSSSILKKFISIYKESLVVEDTISSFRPLSSDYGTLDGLNISGCINDEVHAWKDPQLYTILETAMGSREAPLLLSITTAGVSRESICKDLHDYTENILNEIISDDTFFGIIYTLDEDDAWDNPDNYIKANPSLGASLDIEELKEALNRAKNSSIAKGAFKRLRLNIWTSNTTGWINYEKYKKTTRPFDYNSHKGHKAYIGLDLSSTSDLTALSLMFKEDDGSYSSFQHYYLPEDNIIEKERLDRVPYTEWAKNGLITLTPGEVIDYDYIENDILNKYCKDFEIVEIVQDPYNSVKLTAHLRDKGLTVIDFKQGFLSMSPATKGFEVEILSDNLHIDSRNNITHWNITNCEVLTDAAGNIKLTKEAGKRRLKIDGVIASIMAFARCSNCDSSTESTYEENELLVL